MASTLEKFGFLKHKRDESDNSSEKLYLSQGNNLGLLSSQNKVKLVFVIFGLKSTSNMKAWKMEKKASFLVIIVAFLENATIGYWLESLCVCLCVCVFLLEKKAI